MSLGSRRSVRRAGLVTASALLRVLLIIAVVVVPVLECPATTGVTRTSAVALHAEVSYARASLTDADDHHECFTPTAVTAAVAAVTGTLSGWVIALTAMASVGLATCAMWRLDTRGPSRAQPHWLLSDGRDRLLHFCMMRR